MELILEEYRINYRDGVESKAVFSYINDEVLLTESNFYAYHEGFDMDICESCKIEFSLDKNNTQIFFNILETDSKDFIGIEKVVTKFFKFTKSVPVSKTYKVSDDNLELTFSYNAMDYFYEYVISRIEESKNNNRINESGSNKIETELKYIKLFNEGKLPDYQKVMRPLDKLIIYCLKNSVNFTVKYISII